jgi:hypothetical protein
VTPPAGLGAPGRVHDRRADMAENDPPEQDHPQLTWPQIRRRVQALGHVSSVGITRKRAGPPPGRRATSAEPDGR